MKFRRIPCDCCKTSAERLQCKSPTYVLSDVVDDSNVIFLLMSKRGRTTCGGPLAIDGESADGEPPIVVQKRDLLDDERALSRVEAIVSSCRCPSFGPAANDDAAWAESPFRRNQRLLEEASGFWPKRARIRDADAAQREFE